ncbi:16S rRNA (cytidine(1402)-2'-O)-methyltransferase [Kushneria indalinina]|uniref:Ribosomal RNA small subunit methyltransferase I n=1 Tax=Kushneria indalinina DSM 14324 TaxID=1122140 RepID=A0A3D9E0E8_9GAMM|nr:16S rRNA (cytidine(1402)-2'-O)-methyltransferase [Kushneria indalinina]REC96523.1 16S rRNA (cytidine1402-2'-O)-methyltransferase [Kushneria indalinina DSM 14324]
MNSFSKGALYVVATPIGNLDDLSRRAMDTLAQADLIAAEDTRHSVRLLDHIGVRVPLVSLHEHNETSRIERIRQALDEGQRVALISDAGTPLISDPGYRLVQALRAADYTIIPIPGPSALITALSAAGLPTERFLFEGFLPAKSSGRRQRLGDVVELPVTLVLYESPHRIRQLLEDIEIVCGERPVVIARELTKTFETFLQGTARELLERMAEDADQVRGEFVVMMAPAPEREHTDSSQIDADQLLSSLLEEGVGVKQSASVATRVLGGRKSDWYQRAQTLKDGKPSQ